MKISKRSQMSLVQFLAMIKPHIDGVQAFEDELTSELESSKLTKEQEIMQSIANSAQAFKQDRYDECLRSARVALETLAKSIVKDKFDKNTKEWHDTIDFLSQEFLICKEKWLIKNTYGFLSESCHNVLDDEEWARFGRNLAMSMCYYLVKKVNFSKADLL